MVTQQRRSWGGPALAGLLALALGVTLIPAAAQQPQPPPLSPDQAAMMVLDSARRAYNEGKLAFAAKRFGEFLKLYGGHKEAPAARYGLALSLLTGPTKDYVAAAAALQPVVGIGGFPDRPFALYYMGVACRGMGEQALAEAKAKKANPAQATADRNRARGHFEQAAKHFAAAGTTFAARVKRPAGPPPPPPPGTPPPADLEWAARARCDHCEMLLRTAKFKEGGQAAAALLADPALGNSRYRSLGLYHLGYAHFAQKDYVSAGRALSQLAPFRQEFGVHARYLLARTHHLAGERPEAAAQYKAVLAGYEEQRKSARETLKKPAALSPERKAFAESLVTGEPPDYVVRASFYAALVLAEQGRYGQALAGFVAMVASHPKSPLVPESQLRQGFCQMQLRNFPEAIKLLQPLAANPELADRALWWLARSQVGGADRKNAPAYAQILAGAMNGLRRAAALAGQAAKTDPDAKVRRGDILLELADSQQLAGQFKGAAATYAQALAENNSPDRAEEAMQRQVTALHLAGQYKESDDLCVKFEKAYSKSTLLGAVLFRAAENAYLTATVAGENPNLPNRQQALDRLFGEAIARYRRVIEEYPDFPYVNLGRQGMATAYHRLGRFAEAAVVLEVIPEVDRNGELATVNYLLADCLVRLLPAETDDALGGARLLDQAEQAAKLLEGFLAAQAKGPQAPDALLKMGHCYQRIAAVLAEPAEQKKILAQARGAYDRLLQQFGKDPAMPSAVFERAKCLALLGQVNPAIGELNRFRVNPLRNSSVAPLALIRLSSLLRSQNKAAAAVAVMAQCRAQHEAILSKDPARQDWVPALQYEHALAVKESGKPADARAVFDALAKKFPDRPEAVNALWRAGQCRREVLMAQLSAARAAADKPGANADQVAAASRAMAQGAGNLRQAAEALESQSAELGRKAAGAEPHLRMLYEVAWCYRLLADVQIESAVRQLQREALAELAARLAREKPPGQVPPGWRPPQVSLSEVPMQSAERAAHQQYERLIAASPEAPLAIVARFELAEMHARREQHEAALQLLAKALELNPAAELAEKVRLRLAAALLARDDAKSALAHIQAVAGNRTSAVAAEARYLAGEAYILLKDWGNAIKQLVPFRDHGPLQRVPEISDRALLRLGFAYAQAGQWDASRQALTILVQRFGRSPWVCEAYYDIGRAWQSQKQHDRAVNAYAEVTRRTAAEVAARAQLQTGLCRLEQKRYPEAATALLVVPFTYDYPQLSAAACCEAGRAYVEMKQPAEAARMFRRVIEDYPESPWAQKARQRLAQVERARGPQSR